jgi:hypothetical protein
VFSHFPLLLELSIAELANQLALVVRPLLPIVDISKNNLINKIPGLESSQFSAKKCEDSNP